MWYDRAATTVSFAQELQSKIEEANRQYALFATNKTCAKEEDDQAFRLAILKEPDLLDAELNWCVRAGKMDISLANSMTRKSIATDLVTSVYWRRCEVDPNVELIDAYQRLRARSRDFCFEQSNPTGWEMRSCP